MRVAGFGPARAWGEPGSTVDVELTTDAAVSGSALASVELLDGAAVVGAAEQVLELAPGRQRHRLAVRLPERARRGYGLRLRVDVPGHRPVVRRSAVEALSGWWQSPRHVALTEFGRAGAVARRVASARGWHVTVAQAYDWMWRHHRYAAPSDPFVDTLGRRVSHRAVRAAIAAGHEHGIATLAYGSVYGAEREYVDEHPDERLFDESRSALSLGDTFFITDLRPRSAWRRRLLDEYEAACRDFGFDGVHMDTYGPPHEAIAADGERIRFAELYPGLIDEAAERVGRVGSDRRVLFNCVEGFPLEAVARARTAALYLELWPPDDRFADLVRWIRGARSVAAGRAVVIAAYALALKEAATEPAARRGAIESSLLTFAVVSAAGAYHHTLAEGDRLLAEGYYPAAVGLTAREAAELRAGWAFHARAMHILTDPAASDGPAAIDLSTSGGASVAISEMPQAGAVWARATETADGRVLQLVDLGAQSDDRWTVGREASPTRSGRILRWSARSPVAGSPWTAGGEFRALEHGAAADEWRLPDHRRWLVIVDPA